jgi:hypothetical protein
MSKVLKAILQEYFNSHKEEIATAGKVISLNGKEAV